MRNAWFPFYWRDYTGDTSHLTLVEHGAYIMLMAHYYITSSPLPANALQLQRICRAFADDEIAAVASVLKQFFRIDGESYRHKRIDQELEKSIGISEKRRKAAQAKYVHLQSKSSAFGEQMDTQSQSQSQSQEPKSKSLAQRKALSDAEMVYRAYPRKVGKKDALNAIKNALLRLQKGEGPDGTNNDEALAWLISRTSLFALSPAGQNGKYTPHPATWYNAARYLDDESEWSKVNKADSQMDAFLRRNGALDDRKVTNG